MNQIKQVAQELAGYGRYGDTVLAHISPHEAQMLKLMGGAGTLNPITGLPEYWGGFGGFFHAIVQYVAPVAIVAVAIVAPQVIPALGTLLTTGDTVAAAAILSTSSAEAAAATTTFVLGSTEAATAATVAGGAALGAASGALGSAASGTSVGKGALVGAGTGAVTAGIGEALPSGTPGVLSGASKGAAAGFTGAELSGSNLQQALKSGEIGGITGGITGGLSDLASAAEVPTDVTRATLAAAGPYVSQNVSNLFAPTQTASGGTSGTPQSTLTTTGQAGVTPGSQALGQALNLGGGDISPPVNIGGGEKDTRNVWNIASLRTKDETGS